MLAVLRHEIQVTLEDVNVINTNYLVDGEIPRLNLPFQVP